MAKIYPQRFPQWAIEQGNRSAERKVFEKLAQLPEPYVVFYSAAWQVHAPRTGVQDGEADFIIAHPEKGVLILEVKGGRIRYDAGESQWYSLDRNGVEHAIKDPIQQARNSKGALLQKLRELPGWSEDYLTIAYIMVFPDAAAGQTALPRDLMIDTSDLESLEARIENGFAWFAGEERRSGALGVQRLRLLESLLANSFTLKTPMGVELAQDEARIIELTEQQMRLLNFIQRQRCTVIEGCAGSGNKKFRSHNDFGIFHSLHTAQAPDVTIAGEQFVRFLGTPLSAWVSDQRRGVLPQPAFKHRVNHAPGGFDAIRAGEEGSVSLNGFEQEFFIGFGESRSIEGVAIVELHIHRAHVLVRIGEFGFEAQVNAFVGLDAQGQDVGREFARMAKHHVRRALEFDDDFGGLAFEGFA